MKNTQNNWIDDVWITESYQDAKKNNFKILDDYLIDKPKTI
jgi:hypothetical protein